jgi:cardiolipin synthase
LAWVLLIFSLPPVAAFFYLINQVNNAMLHHQQRQWRQMQKMAALGVQNPQTWRSVKELPMDIYSQFAYLRHFGDAPVYQQTRTKYLSSGEIFWQQLLHQLRQARYFIFLEYYIIESGVMWDQILAILREKVAAGVEVRLMYDDIGCLFTLPSNYAQKLQQEGIKVAVFNRFRPLLIVQMINRDHRKLAVIDGQVGFVGGINLADEYINVYPKFGHWKDNAIMIEGAGVQSLTAMFLQLWQANTGKMTAKQLEPFFPPAAAENDGWCQPFADSPDDTEKTSQNVYLNLINKAQKMFYLTTPYLILDHELVTALTLAAKNGVDVRIVTPTKSDNRLVHLLTQSFYLQLLEAGVRVYEYLSGFIHAKSAVMDQEMAIVGTINFDYRSMNLQYECGVVTYGSRAGRSLYRDMLKILDQSRQITLNEVKEVRWSTKITRSLLRLVAPLL